MNEPQNPPWKWERQKRGGWWLREGDKARLYVSYLGCTTDSRELIESRLNAHDELVVALEAANDLLKQEFGSMYSRFDPLLARVRGEETDKGEDYAAAWDEVERSMERAAQQEERTNG